MRVTVKRFIYTSIILFMLLILLFKCFTRTLKNEIDDLSFSINYSNNLLNEITDLMNKKMEIPFDNFVSKTLMSLEHSSKLCDIKFVKSFPICGFNETKSNLVNEDFISTISKTIRHGGYWIPSFCVANKMVAIIISFRNRWIQLTKLLPELHTLLQTQNICYRIFVIEQLGSEAFNKGRLNNAGFLESISLFHFNCVIFQDVDLIPENYDIPYFCNFDKPLHMAVAVDINDYHLPYSTLIGGVLAFTPKQYLLVNGYSNFYWGWGLEDDDMELRLKKTLGYDRLKETVGRYKSSKHTKQYIFKIQKFRRKPLLTTSTKRMFHDGLINLLYQVIRIKNMKLYTHIIVDIGSQPEEFYEY